MNPPDGASPATVSAAQLRTGDLLLMRSRNELATLTTWFGDSDYDHVLLVGRAGCVIDFGAGGVVEPALDERLGAADVVAVDVRRPLSGQGEDLQDNDRIAVLAHALSLRRPNYAGDPLRALGVLAAVRERELPPLPALRRVLYEALQRVARAGADAMTASEFVYRCFAENPVQPPGRLAPQLTPMAARAAPFPQIDWPALWLQIAPWLPEERRLLPSFDGDAGVDDGDFYIAATAARSRLGLISTGAGLLAAGPRQPNPKWLRLCELERSPSYEPLGRLYPAPGAA
ncbi:hypothetical protein [Lysobacter sp. Hz 25]|uniref:hypothetical protein n=1 Tax=Lysobacter sp. Hz 25 TaxID=3383698 RepID=UPI0038D50E5D